VTLSALAKELGVSAATVSNAYNRPDQLSEALRTRIMARAAALGFAGPDPMARGLRRGRVGAVGVLVDQSLSYAFSDPVAVLFLDGLALELQSDGYGLLLHSGFVGEAAARPVEGADVRRISDAAVDAWVIQSLPQDHPAVAAVQARGRPLVVLDQPLLPGVPVVGIADEHGGAIAFQHLLDLGHRRIAVLSTPLSGDGSVGLADLDRQHTARYRTVRERLAGAASSAAAAGVPWSEVPVFECAANDPGAGMRGMSELLLARSAPTAVLALSDQLAIGALRAADRAGVLVPEHLSVVGFDDAPAAQHTTPALTTVAQPLLDRGRAVGTLVLALLAGAPAPSPPAAPVRLVARASSGPVPDGA